MILFTFLVLNFVGISHQTMYTTHPTIFIFLHLTTLILLSVEKLWGFPLLYFLQSLITDTFRFDILHIALPPNILFVLWIGSRVTRICKRTSKIDYVYFKLYVLFGRRTLRRCTIFITKWCDINRAINLVSVSISQFFFFTFSSSSFPFLFFSFLCLFVIQKIKWQCFTYTDFPRL